MPSRIESLDGAPDEFRLCIRDDGEALTGANLTSELGDTPGIPDRRVKPPRCALFQVPEGALDRPTTVTLETRGANSSAARSETVPLTAPNLGWTPHSPVDVATRALGLAPLSAGYPGLIELHTALRYRLSPAFRAGFGVDLRLGLHTVLLGPNAVLSTSLPLAERWVTHLDAEYLVSYSPRGLEREGSEWVHGPSAVLALGYTGRRFLGAPSVADSGSIGPLVSVEYLLRPHEHDAVWLLGGGFFMHYGF